MCFKGSNSRFEQYHVHLKKSVNQIKYAPCFHLTYFLDICCSRVLRSLISDSCLARTSTKTSRSSDNLVQEIELHYWKFQIWTLGLSFFKILSIYLVSTCPRSCVVCCSVCDWIVDVFRRDSNY